MGARKWCADAIRQAIAERDDWFKMVDLVPRVSELGQHGPISVQRIAQHVRVYEMPLEKRLIGKNRYEYRRPRK